MKFIEWYKTKKKIYCSNLAYIIIIEFKKKKKVPKVEKVQVNNDTVT